MVQQGSPEPKQAACSWCGNAHAKKHLRHARGVRPAVAKFLAKKYPDRWKAGALVCSDCLNRERLDHLLKKLAEDRGELSEIESQVARQAVDHLAIAEQVEEEFRRSVTRGQRIADAVARVGGSWAFVITFVVVLLAWIALNTVLLRQKAFDPYPYILLNLVLSCIAALQAPVIMMSQNRQDARDRMRSEQDYKINLKAELEIRHLMSKLDQLRHHQWRRLLEIQNIQLDLMNELA